MKSMFAFFVERPLIVNMIMVMIFMGGLHTLRTAKVQGSPDIEFGNFIISTVRAGASAEKMELSVTVPLEEELLKVENIKRVLSNSMESLSLIQVDADSDADSEQLAKMEAELQKAIDRAMVRLPADILEKPVLDASTGSDRSIVTLVVSGDASEEVLRGIARSLERQIKELNYVGDVKRDGYRDREVRILLDPQKIARLAVSYNEIEDAIRSRNVSETGGSLESFTGEQDVIAIGEFENPEDVGSVIVRANENGDYLRLEDIATVVMDYEDWQNRFFYKRKPAIQLDVRGERVFNEFDLVAGVRDLVARVEPTLPANVEIAVVADGSSITRVILDSLLTNAAIGGILITLALLFFFPLKTTFWVVAGLPIAILIGLMGMRFVGIETAATAMVAVIMILGLLVDDAIVASESMFRHFELGQTPHQAAINGIADVAQPIFTGALTTIIAMSPLLLIGGTDAKFMWIIPATVVLMIIGSLFECFILLPSHIAESLKHKRSGEHKAGWFKKVEVAYRRALNYYLMRPFAALLLLLLGLGVGAAILSQSSNFQPYPDVDADTLMVTVELPVGASSEDTRDKLFEIEQRVQQSSLSEHIESIYLTVGNHSTDEWGFLIEGQQQNWGKLSVRLTGFNDRRVTAQEILAGVEQSLEGVTGVSHLNAKAMADQPPTGHPVELQVILDQDGRQAIADEILTFLEQHTGVTRSWSNYAPGKGVIDLQLKHERLADYGLKVADITRALRIAFDGVLVEELQTREELVRFRLQLADRYRNDINALRSLAIIGPAGDAVPLRNVANFEMRQGQLAIRHYAGVRTDTVSAEIDRDRISTSEINAELARFIAEKNYYQDYPGVRFVFGGEIEKNAETAANMSTGLLIVVIAIFFLMVTLFNSLSLPISTLLVVPVAFTAVLVIFVVHGLVVSTAAMVGLLALIGVLSNGALVMIDQIRKLHIARSADDNSIDLEDIIDGAVLRLRPLLITAITTIVGLGPAAYGIAGTHPTTQDLLLVMFWGVAVGAVVTLFTLPLFLVLDGRIKAILGRR